MDATGVDRGGGRRVCARRRRRCSRPRHPDRVRGLVAIAPWRVRRRASRAIAYPDDEVPDTEEGWAKYNQHHWLRRLPRLVEFFFGECSPEPHSTKVIEDCVGWAPADHRGRLID